MSNPRVQDTFDTQEYLEQTVIVFGISLCV